MNKKNDLKLLKFPNRTLEAERQVEAILFAAEEPLDLTSIETRMKVKANIPKILESLVNQYKHRGINLICISGILTKYHVYFLCILLCISLCISLKY